MARQRVRERPRVSLNALGEYLVASAAQRRRILAEQKRPRDFQVTYYAEAEEAITQCLAASGDLTSLDRAGRQLQPGPGLSEWEVSRKTACREAVQAFRKLLPELPLDGLASQRATERPRQLQIGMVQVSVRPEVILTRDDAASRRVGGIKLYFSKNDALSEERAKYAATVLHRYVELHPPMRDDSPDHGICIVADVFAHRWFAAPRTYKRRRQDVEAACQEIAVLWESV